MPRCGETEIYIRAVSVSGTCRSFLFSFSLATTPSSGSRFFLCVPDSLELNLEAQAGIEPAAIILLLLSMCWDYRWGPPSCDHTSISRIVHLRHKTLSREGQYNDLWVKVQLPGPTWWRERTDFIKLSPDLHMHTVAHTQNTRKVKIRELEIRHW